MSGPSVANQRAHPLRDGGRRPPREAARAGRPFVSTSSGSRPRRQHLDRRAHAGLGLLLLRRDARAVLPGRPARRRDRARTRSRTAASASSSAASRRAAAELARDGAVLRAQGGHAARHRARASRRSTGRTARTSASSRRPTSGSSSASSAARRSRSSEFTKGLDPISADDRRARRALRLQPGAPRGRGDAARDHDARRGR